MTTRHVVLLRGVNVGRGGRLAMSDLRALLEADGRTGVATVLNSGNAVLSAATDDPAQVAAALEAALERHVGRRIAVLARTAAEWTAMVEANPFAADRDPKHLQVAVLGGEPDPAGRRALTGLDPAEIAPDELALGDRVVHLHLPHGVLESRALPLLERTPTGTWATVRTWGTIVKIVAKL